MNLRRISTRVAVAGVSTAIAAGGLVAATGVAANAETVVNTCTCSNAAVGITKDFDLTVDGAVRCRSTGPALRRRLAERHRLGPGRRGRRPLSSPALA